MANTAQATKRARQNKARASHNGNQRSRLRTAIKNLHKNIDSKEKTVELKDFQVTASVIDSSAAKGLIHRNKAARLKSRLNQRLKNQDSASK